ncbi:MAG: TrkH family potassium uptake protein [Planctomycetes bacterium]|nr:TrkH family potassium uptake protein [Planctomycetota bacterium]
MRKRFRQFVPVVRHLGGVLWILGFLMFTPLIVVFMYKYAGHQEVPPIYYLSPAVATVILGWMLAGHGEPAPLDRRGAMLVCGLGWIVLSAMGALPFCFVLRVSYLDAYFETVSGFTTTGITMLTGLDNMAHSIIFWRALIQWLGGLGILTFFLTVVGAGGESHRLFSAESHKIFSKRPAPSLFRTLRILWTIYGAFTLLIASLLVIAGSSVFDAITHSFTCLSTGGYSPYDASIAHYAQAGYAHYRAIEYIVIFGMILGGTNFFVHYRLVTGDAKSLWDNMEVRLWWLILLGATGLVIFEHWLHSGIKNPEEVFRHSLFQVVSIGTTTGYATEDIAAYPSLSRQIFLILMVIGGCVGSTGGGIKVMRIGVLAKMVWRQVRRVVNSRRTVNLLLVDGEQIEEEEIRRIAALFFGWIVLLAIGAGITAFLSHHGPLNSASGMFSALGNIGPCYISVQEMTELSPLIKITYIFGMLAGRLEILPILMLFCGRTWK